MYLKYGTKCGANIITEQNKIFVPGLKIATKQQAKISGIWNKTENNKFISFITIGSLS